MVQSYMEWSLQRRLVECRLHGVKNHSDVTTWWACAAAAIREVEAMQDRAMQALFCRE